MRLNCKALIKLNKPCHSDKSHTEIWIEKLNLRSDNGSTVSVHFQASLSLSFLLPSPVLERGSCMLTGESGGVRELGKDDSEGVSELGMGEGAG